MRFHLLYEKDGLWYHTHMPIVLTRIIALLNICLFKIMQCTISWIKGLFWRCKVKKWALKQEFADVVVVQFFPLFTNSFIYCKKLCVFETFWNIRRKYQHRNSGFECTTSYITFEKKIDSQFESNVQLKNRNDAGSVNNNCCMIY